MTVNNKFLELKDYSLISYQSILKEMEYLYTKVLKKKPHYGESKYPNQIKIQWCRDWEFPWAIIRSEVKSGEKVLDCGCGGSPLLYFLSNYGCKTYGIDINDIFRFTSLPKHYIKILVDFIKSIKNKVLGFVQRINKNSQNSEEMFNNYPLRPLIINFLKGIISPDSYYNFNNLRYSSKDPKKYGFNIKYFKESLDNMHFEDNSFDKVFCISVIEHLPEDVAFKGIKEMSRVLKKGGLLVVTLDHDGDHVNPNSKGKFKELIESSGLKLYGESNFKKPEVKDVPGDFNVIGFVLKK